MSDTMTAASASRLPRKPAATARRRARAVLATEWIKLRSLRSMLVTPPLTALVCIGLATFVCANTASQWPRFGAAEKAAFDPLDINFQFVIIGALFLGVLGALVVTNEYGSGLIRTTLAATPQRGAVLAAKAVLVGLIAFTVSVVICFTGFFTGQAMFSAGPAPHVSIGDPGVLGHVMGSVYYLTAVALIGLFVGVLVRNAAAAISGVFALLLVLPVIANKIPANGVTRHTVPYLPFNLGWSLWHSPTADNVSAGVAVLALAAWVLILGAGAALALRGRDA